MKKALPNIIGAVVSFLLSKIYDLWKNRKKKS
jgi:hypothetical protein